jgi:hypothetical protein
MMGVLFCIVVTIQVPCRFRRMASLLGKINPLIRP